MLRFCSISATLGGRLPHRPLTSSRSNRLVSDGTYNYDYDDEGNMFRRTRISGTEPDGSSIREFRWDHRNRLTSVIDKRSDGTATQEVGFTYDGINRRISKSVDTTPEDAIDTTLTHFVYDREDVLLDFDDEDVGIKHLLVAYAGLERDWDAA